MTENNNGLKEILVENERIEQFEASDEHQKEYNANASDYRIDNNGDKDAKYWLNVLFNE